MTNEITEGKLKQIRGKAREQCGKVTGNVSQEIRGKAERVAGKAQERYGNAKRNLKKTIED
jgi:uncharacterized protein YjbJ (UPF0337 family)